MDLPGKSPGAALHVYHGFAIHIFSLFFFCSKDKQQTPGTSNRNFVLFVALSSHCFLVPEVLYKKKKILPSWKGNKFLVDPWR